MSKSVAVVTGANKGIGLEIVRGLCKRFKGAVYLTSRDVGRGTKAVEQLKKDGLHPQYHQLDISDNKSVEVFRDYIKQKYGGIDILINNAAINFLANAPEPFAEQVETTIRVNYFSVVKSCEILFPIMRDGGRVVNLASSVGRLKHIPGAALKERFKKSDLSLAELNALMQEYVDAVKVGNHKEEWGNTEYAPYVVSKVGIAALSFLQQRLLADRDIKVNVVHPGWTPTDLTGFTGPMKVEEATYSSLYCALDAPDSLKGQFVWSDGRVVSWDSEEDLGY